MAKFVLLTVASLMAVGCVFGMPQDTAPGTYRLPNCRFGSCSVTISGKNTGTINGQTSFDPLDGSPAYYGSNTGSIRGTRGNSQYNNAQMRSELARELDAVVREVADDLARG